MVTQHAIGPRPDSHRPAWKPAIPAAVLVLALVVVATLLGTGPAAAYPPEPPDAATSRAHLTEIGVTPEGSSDGYDRDKFPHWSGQGDNCNTREVVLARDGSGVVVDDECYPTSGRWYSVYDAEWVESPADVQIDHIVALSEAWHSGASAWTTAEREQFANDLEHAQLIAVSGSSNQAKSDHDPAEWTPPNTAVHCVFAREWIDVKYVWELTIDQAEHDALNVLLDSC